MNDKNFEKMDEAWMQALRSVREKKVPNNILRNFDVLVAQRIIHQQKENPVFAGGWALVLLPALAIVLAVGIWRFFPEFKKPSPTVPALTSQFVQPEPLKVEAVEALVPAAISVADLHEEEIADEIEALKDLGVWTDEDESSVGILPENTFDELDMALENDGALPLPEMQPQ